MNAPRTRRLSFRSRLALVITLVFVAAGAALLAVQYFVVQGLFDSASRITLSSCDLVTAPVGDAAAGASGSTGCTSLGNAAVTAPGAFAPTGSLEATPALAAYPVLAATGAVIQQTRFLSDEVVGGLLGWSVAILAAFAILAAAIAFWLARRSLGRIGEVTATARDISERDLGRRLDLPGPDDEIKELGDTIDGMLDRLQSAFAAQDRFVANASHELRTPLTTTRTALEIPLAHGDVPAELVPAIRTALRATRQSERLIAALLSLSRGRIDADGFEPADLEPLVATELAELAGAAAARRIAPTTELVPVVVHGDAVLLARAARNLLDNAIRHNVDGGHVHVRLTSDGLEVENGGEELDPETVALLAEPFHRGAGSRVSEGMGLGLAIVESIAAAHGGELRLTARPGGGLIATLRLPRPGATAS
ncbi:MAG: HAMP domain-containing protein [Microbacteriaceae bacterium]|nr:HAMP domain-containing protein [Microbacteriaceae bacterium]